MFRKLVLVMGCALLGTWVWAPAVMAQRGGPPPEGPPASPPPEEAPPDAAPPDAAPPDPAPPVPEAPPPEAAVPEGPPPEVRTPDALEQEEQEEEVRPRVSAGVVIDPAPAPVARPAPVRLPFTGGGGALTLAGAALALGGLAIMAGQPTSHVPETGPVGLLHQGNAAPTLPGSCAGDGDGRRPGVRLRRRR